MSDELPEGWITTPLSNLLTALESGSRPRGGVRGISEGVPSIGGEHLKYDGTFNFGSVKYVPEEFAATMTRGRIRTSDILVVKDGATTAKTAFVDSSFPFGAAVVNEHVFVCRPVSQIEPRFLFRFLMSKNGQDRILENFQGSAQGGINHSFARNTNVPLAPIAEQRRIIAKLEKLLGKVDANRKRSERIPALLKRFRQSTLAAACSGRLTADWREGNDDVREEWREIRLDKLLVEPLANGRSVPDAKDGFPVLRLTCLKNGLIDLNERKNGAWTADTAKRFLVAKGDFFVSRGNGSLALVGRGGLVEDTPDAVAFPDTLIRVRVKQDIIAAGFLRTVWNAKPVRDQIEVAAHTTAGIWKISQSDLEGFVLPIPPLAEQQEIVRRVEVLFAIADQIEARYAKAQTQVDRLTQSLLAKAFRGQLVTTEAELARREGRDYENAQALLVRVSARNNRARPGHATRNPKREALTPPPNR